MNFTELCCADCGIQVAWVLDTSPHQVYCTSCAFADDEDGDDDNKFEEEDDEQD